MNNHLIKQNTNKKTINSRLFKSSKSGGIGKRNFIWDRPRHQLILIMESEHAFKQDIEALIEDNRLILEVPLIEQVGKPIRTHKVGHDTLDEFENGLPDIRFAEMKLKSGYQYSLISCQVINDSLLKVILRYRPAGRYLNN
jgi:hypothetical protein